MKLLCDLSGHVISAVLLPNQGQGFRFTRCTRCNHDLIQSTGGANASWTTVPRGFRVDWGRIDLSAFERRSMIGAHYETVRHEILGFLIAAPVACAVIGWEARDRMHRMLRRFDTVTLATRRVIRVRQPKHYRWRWNVAVQFTIVRDRSLNSLRSAV